MKGNKIMVSGQSQGSSNTTARPLSPHLTIYKPIPTMVMSILHRITGVALYVGMFGIVWWLYAVASGAEYFALVSTVLSSFFGRLVLFVFTYALMHHLAGGIRHFFWDFGYGFSKKTATTTALLTPVFALVSTVLIWIAAYGAI